MKTNNKMLIPLAGLLLTILPVSAGFAQDGGLQAGPPPPRPPMSGGGPPVSAANAPLGTLDQALKLSGDQDDRICTLQKSFFSERGDLMPGAPPPPRDSMDEQGPGQPPAPPGSSDPAIREKVQALDKAVSAKIEAVLTDSQKSELAILLKDMNALRAAGIPPELYTRLGLSPS